MPIIDLQRRMVEVGRLRMGEQVPYQKDGVTKYRAAKLANWRLTSRDRQRLEAAAMLYGGDVRAWEAKEGEFELYCTTAELPILLVPGQTLSQWYETWTGGGCVRRCDGLREVISEGPCVCDAEGKKERTCKPTTRLSVMLPDVPGLGVWRLESHGYYAAVELAGTSAMLETATAKGQLLPARLRIDQRTKVDGGKTTKYAVPVIDIDIAMRQALPAAQELQALDAGPVEGYTPLAPGPGVTLGEGLEAVARESAPAPRHARSAAPMGDVVDDGLFGESAPIPVEEPTIPGDTAPADETVVISDAQRTLLWATVTDRRLPEPKLREIVERLTGQTSTKAITRATFEGVLDAVKSYVGPANEELQNEISGMVDLALAFGREKGNEDAVRAKLEEKRLKHVDTPEDFRDWLKGQIAKIQSPEAAAA